MRRDSWRKRCEQARPARTSEPARRQRALRLALILLLVLDQPLIAAVIIVDGSDSTKADDLVCTLREAIKAANDDSAFFGCSAGSGADTIELTGDVTLDVVDSFNTGLPSVSSKVTVRGKDKTIFRSSVAGTPDFRIFRVAPSGDLTLRNTTMIINGSSFLHKGGGIENLGKLSLINSSVALGAATVGGGIFNYGVATLTHSTVSGNKATKGGGIYSLTDLRLTDSNVSANSAMGGSALGGGIHNSGTLAVIESAMKYNIADSGGGVFNYHGSTSLTRSTVSANFATGSGGGIASYAPLQLINSTVSGNSASGGGGGIMVGGSQTTLLQSTLAANTASVGSGVHTQGGTVSFQSSLITNSSGSSCSGTITNSGVNLADDTTCGDIPSTLDLTKFDSLQDNGGPTETHALLAGSNAIDQAGSCGLFFDVLTDQRNALRGNPCDIGAYEYGADDRYELSGTDTTDDTCFGHRIQFGRPERHLHTQDVDWIFFGPVEGATYEIETTNLFPATFTDPDAIPETDADTFIELYRGCSTWLAGNDDWNYPASLASKISYQATSADALHGLSVAISEVDSYGIGKGYDVTVTCTSGCPPCAASGAGYLGLADEWIVAHRQIEACYSIFVTKTVVGAGGSAILRVGDLVEFGDGFQVKSNGSLVVEIDPDLQVP